MKSNHFLIYVFGIIFLAMGCENQSEKELVVDENEVDSSEMIFEEFEPHISIDSLMKIEEELDKKIEAFGIEMDSFPVDFVDTVI